MPLTQEDVDRITPDFPAPLDGFLDKVEFSTDLGSRKELETPRGRRLSWTQYLIHSEFSDRVIDEASRIDGAWHAGIGLVKWRGLRLDLLATSDRAKIGIEHSGYTWGAVIYSAVEKLPFVLSDFQNLDFENRRFPIIVRHARNIPQALKVRNSNKLLGTGTCWAKGRSSNSVFGNAKGSLTASHVVGAGRHKITVDDNGTQYVANNQVHAPPGIDAVFLETGWPFSAPISFTSQPLGSLAVGDPTSFSGAISTAVSGYVTDITAHAKYTGSGIPMILCHDGLGQNGDSGSIVNVNGKPTALHLSQIALDTGGNESRTILLQQVEKLLDADLYK